MIPNWVRDFLLLPLFVGIVVTFVTFVLPTLSADLELSYELEGPLTLIDERVEDTDVEVRIKGKQARSVFCYMARLWNSGTKPITELPVRFQFAGAPALGFQILSVTHKTKPAIDFGAITEVENTNNSIKVKYGLLNPGDEDVVRFLFARKAPLFVFAKAEGVSLVNKTKEKTDSLFSQSYMKVFARFI